MKKLQSIGLLFLFVLMSSCSKENVMEETSSQVKKQEVFFSFFEKSIEPIGQGEQTRVVSTRATDLKSQKLYTELEVCLIPKGEEYVSNYCVRQENWEDDFGTVSLAVPPGEYTLIAVAAKTNLSQDDRIDIKSRYEMTFPNNSVTDMAYATQDITVESGSNKVTQNIGIKRGVTTFRLESNEQLPMNAKTEIFTITGDCGNVFNPSTGFCKETATITKTFTFDPKQFQEYPIKFNLYLLLTDNDVSNISITAVGKDTEGNVMKTCSFNNVHFIIGQRTTYTGPIFTYPTNSMTFTMSETDIPESSYGKNF